MSESVWQRLRSSKALVAEISAISAVIAALIAGSASLISWRVSEDQMKFERLKYDHEQKLADQKLEACFIFTAVATGNPDQAATNLQFLVDVGLLSDPRIEKVLANRRAGTGKTLPPNLKFGSLCGSNSAN